MIASNFIDELFPYKFRNLIHKSLYTKHLFGITLLLVTIVMENKNSLLDNVKQTLKLYSLFIMLINNYTNGFVTIVSLTAIYFIIASDKVRLKQNQNDDNILKDKIKNGLELIIYLCMFFGFISYYGNIRTLKGKSFVLSKFLFGDEEYTKLPLGVLEGSKAAFAMK